MGLRSSKDIAVEIKAEGEKKEEVKKEDNAGVRPSKEFEELAKERTKLDKE